MIINPLQDWLSRWQSIKISISFFNKLKFPCYPLVHQITAWNFENCLYLFWWKKSNFGVLHSYLIEYSLWWKTIKFEMMLIANYIDALKNDRKKCQHSLHSFLRPLKINYKALINMSFCLRYEFCLSAT